MAGELGVLTQPDKPSWYVGTCGTWHEGTGYVGISKSLLRGEVYGTHDKYRVANGLVKEKLEITSPGRLLELLRLVA